MTLSLQPLDAGGMAWANAMVREHHYLRKPVDPRCSPEGYAVLLDGDRIGCLLFAQPECTRCRGWFGSLSDIASGWAPESRWCILNLARVWLSPSVQSGGSLCSRDLLPGYVDRSGIWRSTLASTAVGMARDRIVLDYLVRRPPVFLEQPYQLTFCLSYCDTRYHRGTLYRAAGFHLHSTNRRGLQTYRIPLRPLDASEDQQVRKASLYSERSRRIRSAGALMPVLEGL